MNFSFFIARRIAFSKEQRFSRLIIRIATVAVALSVGVMIASAALIAGFKREISKKIFEFWGHIHISDTAYSLSFEPSPVSIDQAFYPHLDTFGQITYNEREYDRNGRTGRTIVHRSHGGVQHIQAYAHKPGIIRTKTAMEGILLKGVGADFDVENLNPYLMEGRFMQLDSAEPSRDILISRQTADRLQVGVGDQFIVYFVKEQQQLRRRFSVCGIYKTGLEEYDRKIALCDIRVVQELLGWQPDEVAGFEVWLDDIRDLNVFSGFIYDELLPSDLLSVTIREKFPGIFEWLQLQDYNEVVILALMLAVAIINMITAMLILVLERTNMVGILKALGARNRSISRVFLYYAAWITLQGLFWGNLVGLAFCWLQDRFHFIRLNEADYYLAYAPVYVEPARILAINLGTLLITVLFLVLPSFAVTRISPLKAIRFS
ncbi:MAG: FtsX-like permease family protein [Saprospiraceae bacterium]|nr:FtsX-like permease family protein [Saprospiraceae bacterium]